MLELFTQWKHTRMVILTGLTAALYAALLIPFKGIPIIPGFTEIRPAMVIPVVLGLLFGPAGAWGSALGNLIADFFGTLSAASLFGFMGNFCYGLVGYKIWGKMGPLSTKGEPEIHSGRQYLEFALITILSSLICATFIGWGVELLGLFPFSLLGGIVLVNNLVSPLILGPFLLWILYPRVKRWDLLWTEIMPESDRPAGLLPRFGTLLMWIGGLGGFLEGMFFASGRGVVMGVAPFLLLFWVGVILS
ncbi:MAG TPA: QueT transporter family protein [Nitrospiria bacterium]|nr:QueT transporter family protein [Nitrospiria bacterium]